MFDDRPPLDPHPLSPYVSWAGKRNRGPILEVLAQTLPQTESRVLELASGSGMHINFIAPHFAHLAFQPSDKDDEVFEHLEAHTRASGNENVAPPIELDLLDSATWPTSERTYAAILCINVFQVAPLEIASGMMACADRLLTDDGRLLIYGPFRVDGAFTTESNRQFDLLLRSAGVPAWSLEDVRDITAAAEAHGLRLEKTFDMPANNFILAYVRA